MPNVVTRHRVVFVPMRDADDGNPVMLLEAALDLVTAEGWEVITVIEGSGDVGRDEDEPGFLLVMRRQEPVN